MLYRSIFYGKRIHKTLRGRFDPKVMVSWIIGTGFPFPDPDLYPQMSYGKCPINKENEPPTELQTNRLSTTTPPQPHRQCTLWRNMTVYGCNRNRLDTGLILTGNETVTFGLIHENGRKGPFLGRTPSGTKKSTFCV